MADPLVHHGRHFGRTVHALCSVSGLLMNGAPRLTQAQIGNEYVLISFMLHDICSYGLSSDPPERRVFLALLQNIPHLESRLKDASDDDIQHIAELVRHVIY